MPVAVAFVKDGNIQTWDQSTAQTKTIYSSGDVVKVSVSDDGQVIAFLRRSFMDQPELLEDLALWAVNINGENPRELVSVETSRKRLNAAATDSSAIAEMEWLPHTHRLVYNESKYFLPGQGVFYTPDVYVVDTDTLSDAVLAEAVVPVDKVFNSVKIIPSPNGEEIALITSTDLSFIHADGSNWRKSVLSYAEVGAGDAGPVLPVGVWTEDAQALLITGSLEMDAQFNMSFTIWRVAVAGSSPEALAAVSGSHPASVTFSPDGRLMAYLAAEGGWLITPLTGNISPLAIPHDWLGGSYANLHWSPAGKVYTGNLMELCPNATRDSEVCETPLNFFGGDINAIHWIDGTHFLFLTRNPPVLFWGDLNGVAIPIVAWSNQETSHSFAAITQNE